MDRWRMSHLASLFRPVKTQRWALESGFTHDGRLHGVPVWLTDPDDGGFGPQVCAKNWLFEVALDMGEAIFSMLVQFGIREPIYAIEVGSPIASDEL